MSKTRTFKMGHADVFQDKPSEETRRALEGMHKDERTKAFRLVGSHVIDIAIILSDKNESDLATVIKSIIAETNRLKQENKG